MATREDILNQWRMGNDNNNKKKKNKKKNHPPQNHDNTNIEQLFSLKIGAQFMQSMQNNQNKSYIILISEKLNIIYTSI